MREWLAGVVGNDWAPVVSVILAAAVVILLALVLIGLAKRVFSGTGGIGSRSRAPRLAVLDVAAIDPKRKLVLVRRDEVEHLLLIGGQNDVVIEPSIVRGQPQARRARIDPAVRSEPELARDPAPERVGQAVPQRRVPVAPAPVAVPAPAPAIPASADVAPPQRQPIPLVPPVVAPIAMAVPPVSAPVAAEPARVIVEPVRAADTERSVSSSGETRATFGRTPPLVSAIIPPPANPIAASRIAAELDGAGKDSIPAPREREPVVVMEEAASQPASKAPSAAPIPAPSAVEAQQPAPERPAVPRQAPIERPMAPPRPAATRPPEVEQVRTAPVVTQPATTVDVPERPSDPVPEPAPTAALHFNPAPPQPAAQVASATTPVPPPFASARSMATPTLPVPPRAPAAPAPAPAPSTPTPARSLWSSAPASPAPRAPNGSDSTAAGGDDAVIRNGSGAQTDKAAPAAATEVPRTPFADGPILRADEPLIETSPSAPAPAPVVTTEARQPLSVRSFATTIQERRPPAPTVAVTPVMAPIDRSIPAPHEPVRNEAPSHIEPEIHAIHEPTLPQGEDSMKAAPQAEPERELTLEEEMERLLHDFTLDVSDRR